MLKLTTKQPELQFNNLVSHLLQQSKWQLLHERSTSCLFKNTANGKIYEVLELGGTGDVGVCLEGDMEDLGDIGNWGKEPIYMDVVFVGGGYFMGEKAIGTLAQKVHQSRLRGSCGFTEEQLVNTFIPILGAMTRNKIPSFYRMSSQNIVLDSNYTIRLINPILAHKAQIPNMQPQYSELNPYKKLAIIILEATLLLTHDSAYNLIKNFDKFVIAMVGRGYSYKIIGLVLILLNQGLLPVNVQDWLNGEHSGSWFTQLKKYLSKIKQTSKYIKSTKTSTTPTSSPQTKYTPVADQTEDSQNQTISKYRSGKRIRINPEIDEQEQYETQGRKSRKNGFNCL